MPTVTEAAEIRRLFSQPETAERNARINALARGKATPKPVTTTATSRRRRITETQEFESPIERQPIDKAPQKESIVERPGALKELIEEANPPVPFKSPSYTAEEGKAFVKALTGTSSPPPLSSSGTPRKVTQHSRLTELYYDVNISNQIRQINKIIDEEVKIKSGIVPDAQYIYQDETISGGEAINVLDKDIDRLQRMQQTGIETREFIKEKGFTERLVISTYPSSSRFLWIGNKYKEKIQYVKDYGKFKVVGDKGEVVEKSWHEIKKDNPALYLKYKNDQVVTELDTRRWRTEKYEGRDPFLAGVGKFASGVMVSLDPSFHMSWVTKGTEGISQYMADWEYGMRQDYGVGTKDVDIVKYVTGRGVLQSPGYMNIVYPFVGGAAFGAAFKGISLAAKSATGLIGKVLTQVTSKGPLVAGGVMSGVVGADIGYSFATDPKHTGKGMAKVLQYGMQFGSAIAGAKIGAKAVESYKPKWHQVQKTLPSGEKVDVFKKYLFEYKGEPRLHYGKVGIRTGFEPDFTNYQGQQLFNKPRATRTWGKDTSLSKIKAGDSFIKNIVGPKPIPSKGALVPYKSLLPSTQVGLKPISSFFLSTSPKNISFGVVDISAPQIKTGTPQIPYFKEVARYLDTKKVLPDFTTHKGHPISEKPVDDWMSKRIPTELSLSTKVYPKPVPYQAYKPVGFGKVSITPYWTGLGKSFMVKTSFMKIPTTAILKSIVGPSKPKIIRVWDKDTPLSKIKAADSFYKETVGIQPIPKKMSLVPRKDASVMIPKEHWWYTGEHINFNKFLLDSKPVKTSVPYSKSVAKFLDTKKILPKWSTHKGYPLGETRPPGKKIVLRDPFGTALAKRMVLPLGYSIYWGSKPVVQKPFYKLLGKPVKKAITLKDLASKWEMEKSDFDSKPIELGSGRTKLLLKPPKTITDLELKTTTQLKKSQTKLVEVKKGDIDKLLKGGISKLKTVQILKTKPVTLIDTRKDILSLFPSMGTKKDALSVFRPMYSTKKDILLKLGFDMKKTSITGQKTDTIFKQGKISDTVYDTIPDLTHDTILDVVPDLTSKKIIDSAFISKLGKPQVSITEQVPQLLPMPKMGEAGIGASDKAYNVRIKTRMFVKGKKVRPGTFRKINKKPLSYADALALGGNKLDKTGRATMRIEETEGKPHKLKKDVKPWANIMHQFDIKPDGRIVERTAHRISTPGEVHDISKLGWETSKRPKKKQTPKQPPKNLLKSNKPDKKISKLMKKMGMI